MSGRRARGGIDHRRRTVARAPPSGCRPSGAAGPCRIRGRFCSAGGVAAPTRVRPRPGASVTASAGGGWLASNCASPGDDTINARMASRAAPRGRTAARGGCGTASIHPHAFIARLACTRAVTKRAARRPFGSRLKQTVACGPARARADHADPDASAVPRRKTTRSLARRVGKHSVTRVHRHRTSPTCFGRYGPRRAPSCIRHGLDIR